VNGGRPGDRRRDPGFDELRRLRDAGDDVERLKIARELAASDNPMVAMGALRVLADLAPKEALALVDKWFAQTQKGDLQGWQIDRALAALADGKGATQIASDLKESLRKYFRDGGDDVKVSAARALEKQGDLGPMQQLVASLSSDLGNADVTRRAASIDALSQTRSRLATPLLLPLLSDGSDEVRLRTLDALRRTGDATSIERILPLLNDPVAAVRDRATRTIESLRRSGTNGDVRGGGFQFGGRRGSN
jgi:HEAT repeat protein